MPARVRVNMSSVSDAAVQGTSHEDVDVTPSSAARLPPIVISKEPPGYFGDEGRADQPVSRIGEMREVGGGKPGQQGRFAG